MFELRHFVGVSFLFVYFIHPISTKSLLLTSEILGKCSQFDTNINISNYPAACDSNIYCHGKLLDIIQMAHLFPDSKTFVDMKLKLLPEEVFALFEKLMAETLNNPSKDQLKEFVDANFLPPGSEFENWDPLDFKSNPCFLGKICDTNLRSWGSDLNNLWKLLGRKMIDDVKQNPIYYSIIPVDNPVIVPGGRFREFYYWDSYWIIKGLLHSEMFDTVKGMLENFMSIIERFGFIPNGGRIYYTHRSQPPLFPLMVKAYVEATGDDKFAIDSIKTLEHEFQFWMNNHTRIVNGHCLAYYGDKSSGPRPESYREDVETASSLPTQADRERLYSEIKAAAESGMDFSSRWFINSAGTNVGTLKDLKTRFIIPVELNAILYRNAKIIAEFYSKAGNVEKSTEYELKAKELFKAIQAVLWHEDVGAWLDYDLINNKRRNYFTPTNLAPLWLKCYNKAETKKISKLVLRYIKSLNLDKYPGGVPNTLQATGEQWDYPNVWPPMEHILIIGLDNLCTVESKKLAFKWAKRWVQSNYAAYKDSTHMFEKYNAEQFGGHGSGGEYGVQLGFGWSNGVIIDLLAKYGNKLRTANVALKETLNYGEFYKSKYPQSCDSQIYCTGPLLHAVQTSHIFADSKTFVDMPLVHHPDKTIDDFNSLMKLYNNTPSNDQIKIFVNSYFKNPGTELVEWIPTDWKEKPKFLDGIKSPEFRQWAKELNKIWHSLGRKMIDDVKNNSHFYSILPIDNPFIVPGGRFREIYYWDSYWIVRGILHSEMYSTVNGILKNFLSFIDIYGFIPNGGRVYYLKRSQPPLLTQMIKSYFDFTGDKEFVINAVSLLDKEFYYFWNNYTYNINGHKLAAYGGIHSNGPRPESYREDLKNAQFFKTDNEKLEFYNHLKAGAESGMDFSSRFFITSNGSTNGNLTDIKAGNIIPVELNAFLYGNAKIIAEFYGMAGNQIKQNEFEQKADEILNAIDAILWDDKIGVWLDWDIKNKTRRNFFTPTNLSPLWTKAYNQSKSDELSKKILNYLNLTKVDKYPGGVPNTLYHSSEQWDLPNVWPPMQHMLIIGLDNLGTIDSKILAKKWAEKWVQSNYAAYLDEKLMYEKYNAEEFGGHGGGGEYDVQTGFGWSNGVIIDLLAKYGDTLKPIKSGASSGKYFNSGIIMAALILISTLIGR